MKIATWNVNSIRARLHRLLDWLQAQQPDIVCLQELKVTNESFPAAELEEAGYHCAVHGQPTYNGVAVLARTAPTDVVTGLQDGVDDPQARLVAASVGGVRVLSAYVPNGQEVGSDKYAYKLQWLRRLEDYIERHLGPHDDAVLCGDLNMARDELDVGNVEKWEGTVLFNDEMRSHLARLLSLGFVDTVRRFHPQGGVFSWWDYRGLAFPRNDGLRIDFVLASESLAARCTDAYVERDQRKGHKPSDHAPVVAVFAAP